MPRVTFGFESVVNFSDFVVADATGQPLSATQFKLNFDLGVGMGPTEFSIVPSKDFRFSINDVLNLLAKTLEVDALENVTKVTSTEPWSLIFTTQVSPSLKVLVSKTNKSFSLVLTLYEVGATEAGISLGGKYKLLTINPHFTVYNLLIGYNQQKGGMNISAKVTFADQKNATEVISRDYAINADEQQDKTEIVKFPFPTPAQGGSNFKINYVGLGQRFGPPLPPNPNDFGNAISNIFTDLTKNLTTNNPQKILTDLVQHYYHPERDWFVGVDLSVRGWRIRFIFNDPVLYGLQISCDVPTFEGLDLVILYSKLGPDLGVYYGKLTIPEQYRQLNLGVVALTLPSVEIWVYTNGDFLIKVGWPLGPESIGLQIYIFTGGCGFYFGKLRSGDNPQRQPATVDYDPIITFGLAVWFGVGRSFRRGPLSAALSLTLQGTFQGILAWEGKTKEDKGISRSPDYFWFAATVGVVGQLQGAVDLKVIKIDILVRLSVTAGIAFETDYNTLFNVTATVEVSATVKVLFIKISVSFHATISESFLLTHGGRGDASLDGPQNPAFKNLPGAFEPLVSGADLFTYPSVSEALPVDEDKIKVPLSFMLYPAVEYQGEAVANAVALLSIGSAATDSTKSAWGQLMDAYANWLLATYGAAESSWKRVEEALNANGNLPPTDFDIEVVEKFLANRVAFTVTGVDFTTTADESQEVFLLPMLPNLSLKTAAATDSVDFSKPLVEATFLNELQSFFAKFTISSVLSNAAASAATPLADFAAGGVSFNALLFTDYFLLIGRQLAQQMAQERATAVTVDSTIANNVGGFVSRFLLHGVGIPGGLAGVPAQSLYKFSQQQFVVDTKKETTSATLAVNEAYTAPTGQPDFSTIDLEITTGKGEATLPVATPPTTAPAFSGTPELLPPLVAENLWVAVSERIPWQDTQGECAILSIPSRIHHALAGRTLPLVIQNEFPHPGLVATSVDYTPALLIGVKVFQIKNDAQTFNLEADGTARSLYLTDTFRIGGTDDATRDLLQRALSAPSLKDAEISLLYNAYRQGSSSNGYVSTAIDSAKTLVLKSNLSTSSDPDSVFTPLRLHTQSGFTDAPLGPVSATVTEVADFLRIIWENSIVSSEGFYLCYRNEGEAAVPAATPVWGASNRDTATGDSLPAAIFADGQADLQILVKLAPNAPLEPWCNQVVVTASEQNTGALYLGLTATDGPVQAYQPNYPTGCLAFELAATLDLLADTDGGQNLPYSEGSIEQLYHLIQYQLVTNAIQSGWSPAAGPTAQGNNSLSAIGDADRPQRVLLEAERYRKIVPVYNFVAAADGANYAVPNVYQAVGTSGQLQLRLTDVYGNAAAGSSQTIDYTVLYTDQLISLAEWPGLHVDYKIYRNSSDKNLLEVGLQFDPAQVVRQFVGNTYVVEGRAPGSQYVNNEDQAQQVQIALHKLHCALNQIQDTNTHLAITTTLFAGTNDDKRGKTIASDAALRTPLTTFAQSIITELNNELNSPGSAQKLNLTLPLEIDPTEISTVADDVIPLNVWFVLNRDQFLPTNVAELPKVKENAFIIKPNLTGAANSDQTGGVALYPFATAFESVFADYDQSGDSVRMAKRTGNTSLSGTGNASFLWAVRWSKNKGINVNFTAANYTYFTLAPLSNELLPAESATVITYKEDLTAKVKTETFTAVDVDVFARIFLGYVDELLNPAIAAAIAQTDPTAYASIMSCKANLASALTQGLVPVFQDEQTGDLASAMDQFEQALLGKLERAYTTSAVVQTPATTSLSSSSTDYPSPRLYGSIAPNKQTETDPKKEYTVSNGRLQLASKGGSPSTEYLNFLASAKNVSEQAEIELDLVYNPIFLEHLQTAATDEFGYIPSTWLRFVVTGKNTPTQYPLGNAKIPVPLREFPAKPILHQQTAAGTKQASSNSETAAVNPLANALIWTYKSEIGLAQLVAQDELWFDLKYNLPVTSRIDDDALAAADEPSELVRLFRALVAFNSSYESLRLRLIAAIQNPDAPDTSGKLGSMIGLLVPLLQEAQKAYTAYMVPEEATEAVLAPSVIVKHFVLSLKEVNKTEPQLTLYGDSSDIADYPVTISEQSPTGNTPQKVSPDQAPDQKSTWYQLQYNYHSPLTGQLDFTWENIDAIQRQTAKTIFWVIRNARIGSGAAQVNPELIYQTAKVTFSNPAIPQITVSNLKQPAAATLEQTLADALKPLAKSGTANRSRLFKLSVNYAYNLVDYMDSDGSLALYVPSATKLAYNVNLVPNQTSADLPTQLLNAQTVSLDDFSNYVAKEVTAWYEKTTFNNQPANRQSQLRFDAVLFAIIEGSQLPLIIIKDMYVQVPDSGWWQADE